MRPYRVAVANCTGISLSSVDEEDCLAEASVVQLATVEAQVSSLYLLGLLLPMLRSSCAPDALLGPANSQLMFLGMLLTACMYHPYDVCNCESAG